jgi:hypothetical protein
MNILRNAGGGGRERVESIELSKFAESTANNILHFKQGSLTSQESKIECLQLSRSRKTIVGAAVVTTAKHG